MNTKETVGSDLEADRGIFLNR